MEHGMWAPGSAQGHGKGKAVGKVCPEFSPFGKMKGNVYHDNARFGCYPDHQYPRNLERDEDGFDAVFKRTDTFIYFITRYWKISQKK